MLPFLHSPFWGLRHVFPGFGDWLGLQVFTREWSIYSRSVLVQMIPFLHFPSSIYTQSALKHRLPSAYTSILTYGLFPFGALFARLFKSNWMALSQVVAPSIIHDCFSLQHLTSTGRALFHQSFDSQKSFPERRILNLKRGRWRNFAHFAHVGLRHLQAHWLFRV